MLSYLFFKESSALLNVQTAKSKLKSHFKFRVNSNELKLPNVCTQTAALEMIVSQATRAGAAHEGGKHIVQEKKNTGGRQRWWQMGAGENRESDREG